MIKKVRSATLAILPLFVAAVGIVPAAVAYAEDDIKVYLLGTGSPTPSPARFGMSTLVEAGGKRLLFDMGRGSTIRLWQLQIPVGSIDAHFITHMHSDHLVGIPDLWLTGWLRSPFGRRDGAMLIYGPKGTVDMMKHMQETFAEDIRIRKEDERIPEIGATIDAHDITAGVAYEKDGVVVRAFDTNHGEYIKPNFGYKITYRGMSVVLSGDTRYDPAVEREATGTDLLVHEVALITPALLAASPNYREVKEHHTSPEDAGRLFTKAKPKLAVYSHLSLPFDPKGGVNPPTAADLVAATRTTYDGPLVVGSDLQSFVVTPVGVSVGEPMQFGAPKLR